jgi:hypothetical protein
VHTFRCSLHEVLGGGKERAENNRIFFWEIRAAPLPTIPATLLVVPFDLVAGMVLWLT